MVKQCFKCGVVKDLNDFYKHPEMNDGHLNKCKSCTKRDTKDRYLVLIEDDDWYNDEKRRHRDKYYRLGYKDKHKRSTEDKRKDMNRWKKRYPEKYSAACVCTSIVNPEGTEKHHWSYNEEHWKDVIFLKPSDHYTIHRYMIYDQERMMYRATQGVILKDCSLILVGELLDTSYRCQAFYEAIIRDYK